MKTEYVSPYSVSKRQTIPIDVNDPRLSYLKAGATRGRIGAEIQVVDLSNSGVLNLLGSGLSGSGGGNGGGAPGDGSSTPGAVSKVGTPPLKVTNLAAIWDPSNDGQLILTFNFDLNDPANAYFDSIVVQLHDPISNAFYPILETIPYTAANIPLSSSSASQTLKISPSDMSTTGFPNFTTAFDQVEVATYDTSNQTAGFCDPVDMPTYVVTLPAPIISEQDATSSYIITTSNLANAISSQTFLGEVIQEFVYNTANLTSTQVDAAVSEAVAANRPGWIQVGELKTISPTTVFAADGLHRYVRAYFITKNGAKSAYSNYVEATPAALLPANNLPPANVTNVSGAFSNSGSGDDIVISYTLPAILDSDLNKAITIKVKLVPTVANNLSGFFYHTIGSKTETSFTIPKNLIFAQFGQYYKSYTGTVVTQSQYGTDSSTVQNLNAFTRTSSIASVVPVATVTNVIDGYNVQFALGTTGASYGEVYQFFIDPTNNFNTVDMPDYMDATFTSGGTSGQKTFVVNSILMENGGFALPTGKTVNTYVGYPITGTGIPANTWVTSISGSGPYTITVNNNLTQQAAGNYHMQSLVYSGIGPANVFDNLYATAYLILRYYDIYDSPSQNSIVYQVTPTNPSISVIQNAVQVGSGGAIYVGSSATSGSRIVLGPSGNKGPDGSSAYSGIFAFDYGAASGDAASTAIITNPGASSYTFETKNAKIADWSINGTQIQNTLGTSSNYVGLSATGPYSFWAGSTTSGGDAQAKFTVTPGGAVVARNIQIIGSGNNSDILISAGTGFYVYGDGSITATKATITGTLHVGNKSTFDSDVTIGPAGYLLANGTGGAYLKIGGNGLNASPDGTSITTQISSSVIGTNTDGLGISFATKGAYLGGMSSSDGNPWIVAAGKIYSYNGAIELNSSSATISIYPSDSQSNYGIKLYGNSPSSANAITVGYLPGSGYDPTFKVTYAGVLTAHGAIIDGNITATTGYIGTSSNGWIINDSNIISKSSKSATYLQLDAATDSLISHSTGSSAPGSIISFSAVSSGGSIVAGSAQAASIDTITKYSAGYMSSTGYSVLQSAKAFQFFGGNPTVGSMPLISVDPDGSSTTWTNNGSIQVQKQSFTAINTGVVYLNSNDIIIGSKSNGNIYFNGFLDIRNDTNITGAHQYIRNIWISSSYSTPSGGFVGDLWVTY